ncbi:alpha/beta fold hydrolase [Nannocystaceae bacterium ST9]
MHEFEPLPTPVLHSLTAEDGWLLRVWDFSPLPRRDPIAIVVVGHAMMVDSRTLCRPDRPTLTSVLVAAGFRVLVPDLRGHGESGPLAAQGGQWSDDDIVRDVGRYVALARSLEPELPLALLGHSLFGHAALAWLGQHADAAGREVEALIAVACDIWNRRFEPSRPIWWFKRALHALALALVLFVGYMPARRLRLGTADESLGYFRQFHQWITSNRWTDRSSMIDYHAGLAAIRCPFLHVLSEGDRLYARPTSALRMSAPISTREVVVLGRDDAPGELARLRPDHVQTLTDPRNKLAWHWIAGWLRRKLAPDAEAS